MLATFSRPVRRMQEEREDVHMCKEEGETAETINPKEASPTSSSCTLPRVPIRLHLLGQALVAAGLQVLGHPGILRLPACDGRSLHRTQLGISLAVAFEADRDMVCVQYIYSE